MARRRAPQYESLKLASIILRIFASLLILAGLATAIIGLATVIKSGAVGMPLIFAGGAMFVGGVFQYAVGEACLALRDMARNSFAWAR